MKPQDVPIVDPMMVRRVTWKKRASLVRDCLIIDDADFEDIGLATERLERDRDVVDVSRRMFEITTRVMMAGVHGAWMILPSNRWRNFREGEFIFPDGYPDAEHALLYIGNPVMVGYDADGVLVDATSEFEIKNGCELGY